MSLEKEISEMPLEAAYKLFTVILLDPEEGKDIKKKHYHKIRFGIEIDFDIYDYFTNNYIDKPKAGIIIINDSEVEKVDFYTELEDREALIKKILIENLGEEDIVEGRELKE